MGSASYEYLWLDIETNPSTGCSWSGYSPSSNCAYVRELVTAAIAKGKKPGIYSSYQMWEEIMGQAGECPDLWKDFGTPLWYPHYDGKPSFIDYYDKPFGGWATPFMK